MTNAQILVVEDELIIARDVQNMLKSLGYAVPAVVSSGKGSIQKAAETRPDLVLMDIKLKGDMDGVEAAEEIRARFDIPVVYLTAYADDETLQRAKITEPFGYVLKPFMVEELRNTIEMALYKHEMDKERKRAEEEIKESEEKFRSIFESAYDFLIYLDKSGRILDVNKRALEAVGMSKEEVVGKHFTKLKIFPSRELPGVARAFAKSLIGGPKTLTMSIKDKEGKEIPLECSASFISKHGKIIGVMMIARDITERRRAEKSLRESEEKYRALAENSPNGIFISDAERFIYVNQRLCEIAGFSKDELLNMPDPVESLFAPEERERVLTYAQSRLSGDPAPTFYEACGIRKDGEEISLEFTISSIVLSGRRVLQGTVEDITERKRADEALEQRAAQLAVVNQVAQRAAAILELDQLLQEAVAAIQRRFNYYHVGLFLLDKVAGELEMQAVAGGFADAAPPDHRLALGEGIVGWAAETGQTFLANDVSQEPRYVLGILEEALTKAELCVPLKLAGKVIGALDIQSTQLNAFDETDLLAMETLADQLAVAIENARLYEQAQQEIAERKRAEEEAQQRTAQLEALREVGLELTAQLDLDTLLRSIVSRASDLLGGTGGGLYLYRPDRDVIEWAVATGSHPAPTGAILQRGEGLSGRVWESGEPLIVDDYQHWEGRAAVYEGYPSTSVVGVPVRWGEEFLGVLNIIADPMRTFSSADVELLGLFATQAAIAIQNARLYEQEREQRQLAKALEEAAAAVNSTLDLDEVLDRILEQVERIFGGDAFNVMLIEDGVARPVRWRGYEQFGAEELVSTVAFRVSEVRNLQQIVETGEPVVIPDTAAYAGWIDVPGMEWPRSHVAAPIQTGDVTVGFLNLNGAHPGQFGPKDARWLEAFASHVATAIENARLYEQAQRDARTKSVLLREVNHRVKNNMATIVGLLRAAQCHVGIEDQSAYQSIMKDLISQVQGLATVHRLLSASEWAPLLLSELATQIIRSSLQMLPRDKRISVDVAPSSVRVTPAQAHNLALAINELVTNTVKYALRERNAVHITVRIALEDDTVLFEFRNDGPGYPEEILRLERHSVGFDLIQDLVHKGLDGELALHNDQGAVAIIRFPAQAQGE